ncbi:MAG TPA: urease accessory protein UreD [Pilimelia sp.]|nr:urease accessory protein UreD [Pilimelia sp.]
MRASARIRAVADGRGGTRLSELRSEPPLVLRRTGPAEVHLVGGAAGPLGGDRLSLAVDVGPGATLCLRTVAASVALPGADGAESRVEIVATVAAGARLSWLPEPLIAAAGCRHVATSTVTVAEGGWLCWRDELVCGRYGEPPGDAAQETTLRLGGRTLYRHRLAVGPAAAGWAGPAVLGGARAAGSLLLVDPAWLATGPPAGTVSGDTAALLPLAGAAAVATATGVDLRALRRALAEVTGPGDVAPP